VPLKKAMADNGYPCAVRRQVARVECTSLKMKNTSPHEAAAKRSPPPAAIVHAVGLTCLLAGKLSARPPLTQWLMLLVLQQQLLLLLLLLLQLAWKLHLDRYSQAERLDFQGDQPLSQLPM
jgi:hypothetical protein